MFEIRPARPDDEAMLYQITLQTARAGNDATADYEYPQLVGDIYSVPYLRFSPELSFVVEVQNMVSGYCVGTADTRAFEQTLAANWWPANRDRYPPSGNKPIKDWSVEDHEIHATNNPVLTPDYLADNYPAHLHMNLLPATRGHGIGTSLLSHWLKSAGAQGVSAVHVGADSNNNRGIAFWKSRGFKELNSLASLPKTEAIWMGRRID